MADLVELFLLFRTEGVGSPAVVTLEGHFLKGQMLNLLSRNLG